MKKILLISVRSDIGGGPAHMYELAKHMKPEQVFVALPSDGHFYHKFVELIGLKNIFVIPRQSFNPLILYSMLQFAKSNNIDLIHSHGKGAGLFSRLLRIFHNKPIIHTLHGYHDGTYKIIKQKLYAFWESVAALLTSRIVCVSISERTVFLNKVKCLKQKVEVVMNGTPVSQAYNVTIDTKKIVTVSRFSHQKNLFELINVAKRLPDHNFFILGDGEERFKIEFQLLNLNVTNVKLVGECLNVAENISDAMVYLSTSLWEGLPMSILEAMSLGVPVVASDVVGNRDAVKVGVTGYLYTLGDISACVEAIEKAKNLDRTRIRNHHRDNFSSETMVSKTFDIYRSVLKGCSF